MRKEESYKGYKVWRNSPITWAIERNGQVVKSVGGTLSGAKRVIDGMELKFGVDGKGINSPDGMGSNMARVTEKSDSEQKPLAEEEKATKAEPVVVVDDGDEDEDFEEALKSIDARFTKMESILEKLLKAVEDDEDEDEDKSVGTEKANYARSPKNVAADYPTPPEGGKTSDGLQAPKLEQAVNPAQKPFGKTIQKNAFAGAASGAEETAPGGGGEFFSKGIQDILGGKTTARKLHAASGRVGRA